MLRKVLLAGVLGAAVAAAGWTALSQTQRPQGYLAAPVNGAMLIGPPPAADSPEALAERQAYEESRALEGSERWKQAIQDNALTPDALFGGFGCAAGVAMSARMTPATTKMLARVGRDVAQASTAAKDAYERPRPAVGNDRPICIPRDPDLMENSSWPSGHAILGWTYALLLAEAVPEQADAILLRGREFGDSRAICGVHYESDVEAGRTVAAALVAKLHSEPQFLEDMAASKAELAKAQRVQCRADPT